AFRRVEIVAAPTLDRDAANLLNVKLDCVQGDTGRFLIVLDLKLLPVPDSHKTPAYTGEVSVEGQFRVAPEVVADQQQLIAITNGAGILFGAVREMVMGVTARGPWPALMLRTLSFVDMAKEMVAQQASREQVLTNPIYE